MYEEAISSTLSLDGLGGSPEKGYDGMWRGLQPVHITPFGGRYEGSTFVQGGQASDPVTGTPTLVLFGPEWPFRDLQGMLDYYSNQINALFNDWWQPPMTRVTTLIDDRPGDFDLGRPAILVDDDPSRYHVVRLYYDHLEELAHQVMPDLAGEYTSAGHQLEGALDANPWSRPGSIGTGSQGPYLDCDTLGSRISGSASGTGRTLDQVADILGIVVNDLGQQDSRIAADPQRNTRKIEPAPR